MKIVVVLLSLALSSQAFAAFGEDIKTLRSKALIEFYQHLYKIDSDIYFGEIVHKDTCLGDPTFEARVVSLDQVRQDQRIAFRDETYRNSSYPESYVKHQFSLLAEIHGESSLTNLSSFFDKYFEKELPKSGVLRTYKVLSNVQDAYLPRVVDEQYQIQTTLLLDVTTSEAIEFSTYLNGTTDCD